MEIPSVCHFFDQIAYNYDNTENYLRKNASILLGQHLKFSKNKERLLDACSGRGLVALMSHERGFTDISCVDGSKNMLWYCKNNTVGFVPSENIFYHDFENEDFEPEGKVWNHILINAGIQYIPRIEKFIENMYKLLETGGLLSFSIREKGENEDTETDEYGEYETYGYYSHGVKYYLHGENRFRKMLQKRFEILEVYIYQEDPESTPIKFFTAQRK